MAHVWSKYRFERVAMKGGGAHFTRLPNLLLFNIRRTPNQAGGIGVFVAEQQCRDYVSRCEGERNPSAVARYTSDQMSRAIRAILEQRDGQAQEDRR